MKAGWKTTEFWGTVALNVGIVATALTGSLPASYAGILSTVTVVAYTLARTLLKTNNPVVTVTTPSVKVTNE